MRRSSNRATRLTLHRIGFIRIILKGKAKSTITDLERRIPWEHLARPIHFVSKRRGCFEQVFYLRVEPDVVVPTLVRSWRSAIHFQFDWRIYWWTTIHVAGGFDWLSPSAKEKIDACPESEVDDYLAFVVRFLNAFFERLVHAMFLRFLLRQFRIFEITNVGQFPAFGIAVRITRAKQTRVVNRRRTRRNPTWESLENGECRDIVSRRRDTSTTSWWAYPKLSLLKDDQLQRRKRQRKSYLDREMVTIPKGLSLDLIEERDFG